MGITYKIYFRNKEGSTSTIVVYVAYHMAKIGMNYDLCELLRHQVLRNIKLTKNYGYSFHFGSLIVCLAFYFLNSLQLNENVAWDENLPIGKKIKIYLDNLNDRDRVFLRTSKELNFQIQDIEKMS